MSFLNWMSCSMNSSRIYNLFGINSVGIKCSYFLRRNVWSIDISSLHVFITILASQRWSRGLYGTMNSLILSQLCSIALISNPWLIGPEASIISSLIKLILVSFMVNISTLGLEKIVLSIPLLVLNWVVTTLIIDAVISIDWGSHPLCGVATRIFILMAHVVLNFISRVIRNINCLVLLRIINCLIWHCIWIV